MKDQYESSLWFQRGIYSLQASGIGTTFKSRPIPGRSVVIVLPHMNLLIESRALAMFSILAPTWS